jgi:hypothetical protein
VSITNLCALIRIKVINWIFMEEDGVVWTGIIWLKISTNGGLL